MDGATQRAAGEGEEREVWEIAVHVVEARGLVGVHKGRESSPLVRVRGAGAGKAQDTPTRERTLHPVFSHLLRVRAGTAASASLQVVHATDGTVLGEIVSLPCPPVELPSSWLEYWLPLQAPSDGTLAHHSSHGRVRLCIALVHPESNLSSPSVSIHSPSLFASLSSASADKPLTSSIYHQSLRLRFTAHGPSEPHGLDLDLPSSVLQQLQSGSLVSFRAPEPYLPASFDLRSTNLLTVTIVAFDTHGNEQRLASGRSRIIFLASHSDECFEQSDQIMQRTLNLVPENDPQNNSVLKLDINLSCGLSNPPAISNVLGAGRLDETHLLKQQRMMPQPGSQRRRNELSEGNLLFYVLFDNGVQLCDVPSNLGLEQLRRHLHEKQDVTSGDMVTLDNYQVIQGCDANRHLDGGMTIDLSELEEDDDAELEEGAAADDIGMPEELSVLDRTGQHEAQGRSSSPLSQDVVSVCGDATEVATPPVRPKNGAYGHVSKSLTGQEIDDIRCLIERFESQLDQLRQTRGEIHRKRGRILEALKDLAKKLRRTKAGIDVLEKCQGIIADEQDEHKPEDGYLGEREEGSYDAPDEALYELIGILDRYKHKEKTVQEESTTTDWYRSRFEELLLQEDKEVHDLKVEFGLEAERTLPAFAVDGKQQQLIQGGERQLQPHAQAPAAPSELGIPYPRRPHAGGSGLLGKVLPQPTRWLSTFKTKLDNAFGALMGKIPQRAERGSAATDRNDMNIQTGLHAVLTCVQAYQAFINGHRLMCSCQRPKAQTVVISCSALAGAYRGALHAFGRPLARTLPRESLQTLDRCSRVADAAAMPLTLIPIGSIALRSGAWGSKREFTIFSPFAIAAYGAVQALQENLRAQSDADDSAANEAGGLDSEDPSADGDLGSYRYEDAAGNERDWAAGLSALGLLAGLQAFTCKPTLLVMPIGMAAGMMISQVTEKRWRGVSLDASRAALLMALTWADASLAGETAAGQTAMGAAALSPLAESVTGKRESMNQGHEQFEEVQHIERAELKDEHAGKQNEDQVEKRNEFGREQAGGEAKARRVLKGWHKPVLRKFREVLGLD